jgi:hypothetical protein
VSRFYVKKIMTLNMEKQKGEAQHKKGLKKRKTLKGGLLNGKYTKI